MRRKSHRETEGQRVSQRQTDRQTHRYREKNKERWRNKCIKGWRQRRETEGYRVPDVGVGGWGGIQLGGVRSGTLWTS